MLHYVPIINFVTLTINKFFELEMVRCAMTNVFTNVEYFWHFMFEL